MVDLARAFTERGLLAHLVVANARGPLLGDVTGGVVPLIDLGARSPRNSVLALSGYLRSERPRAMMSTLAHMNVAAVLAKWVARSPVRLLVRESTTLSVSASHALGIRGWLLPRLVRRLYRHADIVVAVSHGVARDLARVTGLPEGRIQVIYNPVVMSRVLSLAAEVPDDPWFTVEGPPIILGVGRLSRPKDFTSLIEAFARVREIREARLVILGEGGDRPALEALIRKRGLTAEVTLPGFVNNPYKYMARAGVLVVSSRREGFPNVLVEAMACATPVVSTACPSGPWEILEGGRWGRLVPVGNPDALAEKICEALEDPAPDLRRRAEYFSLERAVDRYLQTLLPAWPART
jgi:glycosyltransferase involved in cell wall biosynthesis